MDLKRLLPLYILAAIVALTVGYYFTVALPGYNRARLALDRDKFTAEEKGRQEKANAEKQAQARYADCESAARDLYWEYVRLNGNPVPDTPGAYNATDSVWKAAEQRKKTAIDDCMKGATLPAADPLAGLPSFDTVAKPKK